MDMQTEFYYENKGECQYKIGQKVPEFAPMNREIKISFNDSSLDIIIGVAIDKEDVWKYLNRDWLSIGLFYYHHIPSIIVTGGYFQVAGNVVIKGVEGINVEEWVNGVDDHVNLVLVNDFDTYEIMDIRQIQLPMMKTIRKILKEQIKCVDGEIQNTLGIIDKGFQVSWMIYYKDEECRYKKETSGETQSGTYTVYEPKEKQIHVYY